MNYFIKGPALKPDITFTDDRIIAGKKEYLYDDITSIQISFNPTMATNGAVSCVVDGKTITLAYTKKDKDAMKKAVSELQEIISTKRSNQNIELKTANDMYDFCQKNGFGKGMNEKWAIKHFTLIEESLLMDEQIEFTFIGLHNYVSSTKHDNNYAYAITNKRIIAAQQKVMGQSIITIDWKNVNDITMTLQTLLGIIIIDTYKETIGVGVDRTTAKNIYTELHKVLDKLQNQSNNNYSSDKQITVNDSYEELKKLKELLDMSIISQEEFEIKKKELLGLS